MSLPKDHRDQLFTFVKRLPQGCKAILTSRRRIGSGSELLKALMRQGKAAEALPYARRAVEIYTRLGSPDLEAARATLAECES